MTDDEDTRWHRNPSAGLGIWGPFVPANDCRECLMLCTGIQVLGGAALWALPGRRPPPMRSLWTNRGIKLAGVLAGTYLMFTAGLEMMRFWLPYDPWVEDAKKARAALGSSGNRGPLIKWFGPPGYQAVSFREWRERVDRYLDQIERAPSSPLWELAKFREVHHMLRSANRETTHRILSEIDSGTFDHDVADPSLVEIDDDEDIDLDDLEFEDLDQWARFEFLSPLNVVVLPHSVPQRQLPVADDMKLTHHVTYAPIPEMIRKF